MKKRTAGDFSFIEPMKALRVTALPAGDWIYELKYDGYRALAFKSGSDVRLVSRNRTNFNNAYPHLIDALKSLSAKNAIIDGEIAALDQNGKPSFQLLQAYGKSKATPLIYYAFDLLKLEGKIFVTGRWSSVVNCLPSFWKSLRTISGSRRSCVATETGFWK
jgi:bifunctional non-homologous end joining protein LigD